jgi:NAD(P)-dependent dehydrogenase (short-subunit alcohol dehydrogenase family)
VAVVIGAGAIAPGWSNGNACAVTYARHGAAVVCADRSLQSAEETAEAIRAEGGKAFPIACDATQEHDVRSAVERAVWEFGRLDIMHNNVGAGGSSGLPDQISPESWDREVAQNLTTAYLGIRCAAPTMREQGGGSIVNISSLYAVRFLKRPSVGYTAGKAAVEALTRACAAGYGREGIRVNCIRIGFSETPLALWVLNARNLPEEARQAELDKTRAKVPLRAEHGDPFDAANAALYLASDEAKHVTGVILSVDGGLACAPI